MTQKEYDIDEIVKSIKMKIEEKKREKEKNKLESMVENISTKIEKDELLNNLLNKPNKLCNISSLKTKKDIIKELSSILGDELTVKVYLYILKKNKINREKIINKFSIDEDKFNEIINKLKNNGFIDGENGNYVPVPIDGALKRVYENTVSKIKKILPEKKEIDIPQLSLKITINKIVKNNNRKK